ncbi:MAG: serine/threonine-protein kinase [Gemmatimonadota bacterium]
MSTIPDRLSTALADRYRIERELGHGGMATVYLAHDLATDRDVALKVLRPELTAILGAERFAREIRITGQLHHPHILPVLDSGEAPAAGLCWYTMPYVEGESLRDRLTRETQLPIEEALRLFQEIAEALDHAHSQGFVHRDLKPENILLQDGYAWVADFGIARTVGAVGGEKLTETGLALGTPHYMSPEQAAGQSDVDARSDIYALGCLLYEMLAGAPPFTGPTAQAIRARHAIDPIPSLRTVRTTVSASVEAAITKALAKVPADRFTSAQRFEEALTAPMPASARSGSTRTWLEGRGRRWAMTAAIVLTLAVGVFALVRSHRASVEHAASLIAVLPFVPSSPDSALTLLGKDLMQLVSATLDQVGGLSTVDRFRVLQVATQTMPYSLDQAAALGRKFGAGSFVQGSLVRDGAGVRLDLGIYRSDTHAPMGPVIVVRAPADSLTALSDSTTWAILHQIWRSGTPPSPSILDITTHSIPALRAFLDGERLSVAGRWSEAADAYRTAIKADSTFWYAKWGFTETLSWFNETDPDTAQARGYEAHLSSFGERDRRLIEAEKTAGTENYSAHLARFRAVAERFPDDWTVWFHYADHLFHGGPLIGHTNAEARAALQAAVDLNPRLVPMWQHLFYASMGYDSAQSGRALRARVALGDYDAPSKRLGFDVSMFDRILQSASGQLSLPLLDSLARAIVGAKWGSPPGFLLSVGFPAAQIEFNQRWMRLVPKGTSLGRAWRGSANAWVARGAWDSALVALDRYAAASRDAASGVDIYRLVVVGAWLGGLDTARVDARRDAAVQYLARLPAEDTVSLRDGRASLAWADGMLAVLRRDQRGLATARVSVQQSGAEGAGFLKRSLAAFELDLQGKKRAAADSLADMDLAAYEGGLLAPHDPYARSIDHLAASEWLLQLGDTSRAVRLLTWHESDMLDFWGAHLVSQLFAPLAYYDLAQIEEAQGRDDPAREHYEQFLRRYDMPVPAHQHLVDEAKAALRRLSGQNDPAVPR